MIEIRPLASQDREAWLAQWDGYLRFYGADLSPEVTDLTWRRLLAPGEEPRGLVALLDGAVCAFAHYLFHRSTWSPSCYCYLEDLYVSPDVRGRGIGRALIAATFDRADRAGATRVYWNTEDTNNRARALYDRMGTLSAFVQYRRQVADRVI